MMSESVLWWDHQPGKKASMYQEQIDTAFADWAGDEDSRDGCYHNQRFLLVERSTTERRYWLTTHASPEDASEYHNNQEYPQDWSIEELRDMETGELFNGEQHTRWTPRVNAPTS